MPELPDVTVYVEALARQTIDETLNEVRLASPFLLRTAKPPLSAVAGRPVRQVERLGKRIVFGFDEELYMVIHLMIAGRFRWGKSGAKVPGRVGLAAFDFSSGTLLLTEASSKKRASLHMVQGRKGLLENHSRGGLEISKLDATDFAKALTARNHTLKRALTDPRIFSGIGNAYSDEILFEARLSPMKLTQKLDEGELARLFAATQSILERFTAAIRAEAGEGLPAKVTAFRPDMMVHGRYKEACKVCETKIMRVAFAENELNYCPRCQNEGRLLADRSLSRLMKKDWPKRVEELE
ncbi:MAG: DNA-formamidopyrimidine glycosylase family protein [Myxococcota bacterium]